MPTRQVKTTNYFSHDSNARNDEKLLRLRMRHGAAGYGVYFMLLERLREEADYTSAKDYNMIAFDLRVDAALVKSVVEDYGLFTFTDDGQHFYSDSFSRRMGMKDTLHDSRARAGRLGMASRWGKRLNEDTVEAESRVPETEPPRTCQPDAVDDDKCLARFFRKENKANIETLLMNFGLKPTETSALRSMAKEIITEWKLTDKRHADYTDWSQHLVNTMRIKRKEKQEKSTDKKAEKQNRQPPKQADYNYSGGFGSKDV